MTPRKKADKIEFMRRIFLLLSEVSLAAENGHGTASALKTGEIMDAVGELLGLKPLGYDVSDGPSGSIDAELMELMEKYPPTMEKYPLKGA
jgi:hypothetical protein